MPADELAIWHLLPPPLDFGTVSSALSSRHSTSADSVVVFIVIVAATGNEEMGGVVLLASLLGRLTLNVSVAGSAPTIEEIMMVSRTVVDSAATALKFDSKPVETIRRERSSNDERR